MRSVSLRQAALAAVVPLALASLAACGNGDGDSTTAADPGASSSSTAPSDTSPPSSAGKDTHGSDVDPAAFVDKLKTAAKAITTARFTMSMDMGGQSVSAKGALDLTGDKPAMQLSMDLTGMGTPTDLRLVDGVMYIQDPTSGGGKYLKMDLSDPNGPLAGMGDALTNYDPQSMIASISPDAFQKVTDLGSESFGGQQLEHYRVVLDSAAASSMFKNLPSSASLPKSVTYDLWLDSQDRLARFKLLMKKVSQVTATYSDYGTDVHITAPDPSQVMAVPGSSS